MHARIHARNEAVQAATVMLDQAGMRVFTCVNLMPESPDRS